MQEAFLLAVGVTKVVVLWAVVVGRAIVVETVVAEGT
jgi:hypothetical protein